LRTLTLRNERIDLVMRTAPEHRPVTMKTRTDSVESDMGGFVTAVASWFDRVVDDDDEHETVALEFPETHIVVVTVLVVVSAAGWSVEVTV